MKINAQFANVVGQEIAKIRLSESIASVSNGGEMLSPLLEADKGVGKTNLYKAYLRGLQENNVDVLDFSSPEEIRSKGANYDSVISLIQHSKRFAIAFDEAHNFHHRPTVQMERVFAFIMKALDKNNQGKHIRLDDNIVVPFDRKRGSFIFATNFPHQLDKSGALQSRFDRMILENYNENQLTEILQIMLKREGFAAANENTLRMVARCGRGTARPMEKIVSQLRISNVANGGKKNTINRDDILHALKLSKMFPRGLDEWEVRLLNMCKAPMRDNVIMALMPGLEVNAFKRSKGYLMGECQFAAHTTQGLQTTDKGTRYLEDIRKDGFAVE